jgi:hypothetical protein
MSPACGRGFAILFACAVIGACAQPACDQQVTHAAPSPDGANIAFVFRRACAAPRGVSTQVSVVPYTESLRDDTGNVLALRDEQPVKISWQGPKTLVVSGFKDPLYQRNEPIHSVVIGFR